jgi:hypothetical protein
VVAPATAAWLFATPCLPLAITAASSPNSPGARRCDLEDLRYLSEGSRVYSLGSGSAVRVHIEVWAKIIEDLENHVPLPASLLELLANARESLSAFPFAPRRTLSSMKMAVSRTPVEVWSKIIGDCAHTSRENHDMPDGIFKLMSVSTSWRVRRSILHLQRRAQCFLFGQLQDIARPYLLLDLRFFTVPKLHLVIHELQMDTAFRRRVFRHTQGVFINMRNKPTHPMSLT